MSYGKIEFNNDGQPKCEICGKFFSRVVSHVRQKHEINEKDYKRQFGFDLKKGICSNESSKKTRLKTLENYDKCIRLNLIIKGCETRFNYGHVGRTKERVSEQTRIRLKERLKEPNMVEAMKKCGRTVGKSGLGNKKRWSFKK